MTHLQAHQPLEPTVVRSHGPKTSSTTRGSAVNRAKSAASITKRGSLERAQVRTTAPATQVMIVTLVAATVRTTAAPGWPAIGEEGRLARAMAINTETTAIMLETRVARARGGAVARGSPVQMPTRRCQSIPPARPTEWQRAWQAGQPVCEQEDWRD